MERLNTKRTRNLRNWLLPRALGSLLFIIAACGGDATATPETTGAGTSSTETTQTVSIGDSAADQLVAAQEQVMINIYRKALPSVVNIHVVQGLEGNDGTGQFPNVPGIPDDFLERGEGSGFVWDDKGRIVTNQHVVDGAETVTVIFSDRTQVLAKVLGGDKDSDLAVLELIDPKEGLIPIDLGDSDDVLVGQLAVAIGASLGLAGAAMQGYLRNPLADPYVLGLSGGAAVGALGAMLLGAGAVLVSGSAFAGALLSTLLVFGLARGGGSWTPTRLLLTGVVVAAGWDREKEGPLRWGCGKKDDQPKCWRKNRNNTW